MKNKERIIWLVSLAIIFTVSLLVVLQYQTKLNDTEQKKTSLSDDNNKLQQENIDSATEVAALKSEIENLKLANYDKTTVMELQRKGFNGQLKDIVADLKIHPELIPYKGVLGGTMGFFGDNDIHVLTNRWVFAYFEDGHNSGYMLLRYDTDNGSITWEVIDSYLVP